jgi:hypothetical protein
MDVKSSDLAQTVALVVLVAAALGLLAWSLAEARRRATAMPLLALAGGVVALPIEPFWDVNVQFAFAANSHPIAFTAFERAIPLYLAFIYPAFIGWGSYLGYRLIKDGATRGRLLLLPAAFFAADAIIEIAGIRADLWSYYGAHAWNPAGWPIYFGVLNGAIPLIGGWLLVQAEARVPRAACALVVPTAYVGIYAVAGWPTWAALNADVPGVVVWAAGAVTVAIAIGVCRLLATEAGAPGVARPAKAPAFATARGLAGSL